jgi:hypothetical protein
MDSQGDIPADSQISTQEIVLESSQIQVPRSRGNTPNATEDLDKLDSTQSFITASITPPPSTQLSRPDIIARTPSPIGLLASPPPTTKDDHDALAMMASTNDIPTEEQIDGASVEDLRQMVSELSLSLREARTSAAHYNLQHSMLMIESSKANNALAVEIEMLQRELDVLQEGELRRRESSIPRQGIEAAANRELISDLNKQINILNSEIQKQQGVVNHLQRQVENRNERIAALEEQNERLRHRIRTNREHMNGIIESVRDRSPISAMNTPSRSYYNTPNRGPLSTPARRTERRETNNMAFDVLLLAGEVINQETATAPSTPKSGHSRSKGPGHVRGTHSLSSLPSTPTRQPTTTLSAKSGGAPPPTLRTPLALSQILEPTADAPPPSAPQFRYTAQHYPQQQQHIPEVLQTPTSASRRRRRASSESTISITEAELNAARAANANAAAAAAAAGGSQIPSISASQRTHVSRISASFSDDEIPESSASQAATSMLRSSGSKSKAKAKTHATPPRGGGVMKQAKLTGGRLSKPSSASVTAASTSINKLLIPDAQPVSPEKRRLVSGVPGAEVERGAVQTGTQASPKKRKVVDAGAVGLGIGI